MNLPNALTMSRFFLAVMMVLLLEINNYPCRILAVVIFAIASLTDFLDGYLAKTRGLVSDFGKIMDPIADKVLLLSILGVLAHTRVISWWIFIVIAVREILVTVSRLAAMRQGQVLAAERAGKIKTVVQIIAVASVLLFLVMQDADIIARWFYQYQEIWHRINDALLLLAVAVTVYSGIDYFLSRRSH